MQLPFVAIVTAAARVDLNRVFGALGAGPNTFSRRCCPILPVPTPATEPTHWLTSSAAASDSDVATLQAMTSGILPVPPPGVVWGVDGVISEAEAIAASSAAVLHVYSAAGDISAAAHAAAVLASEGLMFVPDEE